MIVLALRTDNPQAEMYLYIDGELVSKEIWQAHRELSATIHKRLEALTTNAGKNMHDLEGIVFYQGPGSFTGLRIGVSVVNALGSSLKIPVTATQGENWQQDGLRQLTDENSFTPVEPFYGSEPHITLPKK